MNCGSCGDWKTGIPVGYCNHPDGNFQFTNDKMVFECVTEQECPRQKNMANLMNNIMRIDYETHLGNLRFEHTVVFNKERISEEEVQNLIDTGMTNYDNRVVEMYPEQFDMVFKPVK